MNSNLLHPDDFNDLCGDGFRDEFQRCHYQSARELRASRDAQETGEQIGRLLAAGRHVAVMYQNKTYNVATGIPGDLSAQVDSLKLDLTWSGHAKREAAYDRYGVLPVGSYPKQVRPVEWQLVEVETVGNGYVVSKIVIRRKVDATRSLVLVILLDGPARNATLGIVKTCWTNTNDDNHATLNKSRLTVKI